MKVSVIIPVYNEEKYIKKCLNALMKQTEKPEEIIVVDNNCLDNTIPIAKQFKRVTVIKEKKQGITPARNAGFNKAKGDILIKLDADTILPDNFVKKIKEDFAKHKNIAGITAYVNFYDTILIRNTEFYFDVYMWIAKVTIGHYIFGGPAYAVSKKHWLKVKKDICFDDKKVHEDIDLSIHIGKLGKILFERSLIAYASGRRLKNNPSSFFGEYPLKFLKMLKDHRQ
jgi:glycosyltransferase involved in cell wall biosynthesis